MTTYRWLDGAQSVDLINPIIEKHNAQRSDDLQWALLNSGTAFAEAAFEDDFLIGFVCLQLFPVLGPLWVESMSRNGEISKRLIENMRKTLASMQTRGCIVICENPATERMCRMSGMKKVEYPVYVATQRDIAG